MATLTALVAAGCTSTQHTAQRLQLDSARQRAALRATLVTTVNPVVVAASVAGVPGAERTAVVVTVRNGARRPVTDLPISVGYRVGHGVPVYLNATANLTYFDAHLPAIAPGRSLVWVYTATRTLPRGARLFARIGPRPSAPARVTETGVHIASTVSGNGGGGSLTVRLENASSVPQYELQVYAYAGVAGHYRAAGNITVAELDPGARQRVRLALVGRAASPVHVEVVPTTLQ